jgi:hypothetical protein
VIVGEDFGSSRRLELGHLLLDLLVGVLTRSVEHKGDRLGGEIAATDEPLVILLDAEHAGEPDQRSVVGKDADDIGAPADLLVKRSSGFVDLSLRQWEGGNA